MRIRWTYWLAASLALAAPLAHAQENKTNIQNYDDTTVNQEPGAAPSGTTTTTTEEVSRGVFASPFTVTPAVGALGYGQSDGSYTSRITEGILGDLDFGGLIPKTSRASIGLESGLLYSHIGPSGANFFGANVADNAPNQGANSFLVPIEITAGWSVSDKFRTTLNFGTNMLYRSIGSEMLVGRGDNDTNSVQFFPSIGLGAGWNLGPIVALSFRGDFVPTPLKDMFTATLGATFPVV